MKYGASTSFLDEPMFQALDFGARLDPAILKALGQEEEEESLFRG